MEQLRQRLIINNFTFFFQVVLNMWFIFPKWLCKIICTHTHTHQRNSATHCHKQQNDQPSYLCFTTWGSQKTSQVITSCPSVKLFHCILESGLAAFPKTLLVVCCSCVANYLPLSEVLHHLFLSETWSQDCLLWSFNILTGSWGRVSTKYWTYSTYYCCCQAAWDGAVWCLVAVLYQISCYG